MVATQRSLLALWKASDDDEEEEVDLSRPVSYIDRLRVRVPGTRTNLPPHVDSGSVSRWTHDLYR